MDNYRDQELWNIWMKAHSTKPPEGYADIKVHKDGRPAYFMAADDMQAVQNAATPFDLYLHPDRTPRPMDYSTSAFNITSLPGSGVPFFTALASKGSKYNLSPIHSVAEEKHRYSDIPEDYHKYIPQAIYEHEYGHEKDFEKRLLPHTNKGYITYNGLPGALGLREAPAMRQEDMFWDAVLNDLSFREILGG